MLLACRNGMAAGKAKGASEGLLFRAYPGGADVSLSSVAGSYQPSLLYSTDEEKTWSSYTIGSSVHVNGGKSVSFKADGQNQRFGTNWGVWNAFRVDNGYASVEGHLSSLMGHDVVSASMCFMALFRDCSGLADASGLRFSANWTQSQAQTANACYHALFMNCTALTAVPRFHLSGGTYVPQDGFNGMFQGCTALSDASGFGLGDEPWLNAGYAGFKDMFRGCSRLVAAPDAPAYLKTTTDSFNYMFSYCPRLAQVRVPWSQWNQTASWLYSVSSYGDFYCPRKLGTNETILRNVSFCPPNWTVHNPTETWLLYKNGRTSLREVDGAITRSFLMAAVAEDGQQLTALSAADIGQDVTEIGPSCFLSCSNLRDLWLDDGVSAIGQNAFMKCTMLSGLNWGTGLKAISAEAFRGNSANGGYRRVNLPDGLEALGSGAFMFNQNLSVVTVPSSVSYVGQNAFGNNSNLLSVVFHGKAMADVQAMSDYPWGASGKIFVD